MSLRRKSYSIRDGRHKLKKEPWVKKAAQQSIKQGKKVKGRLLKQGGVSKGGLSRSEPVKRKFPYMVYCRRRRQSREVAPRGREDNQIG